MYILHTFICLLFSKLNTQESLTLQSPNKHPLKEQVQYFMRMYVVIVLSGQRTESEYISVPCELTSGRVLGAYNSAHNISIALKQNKKKRGRSKLGNRSLLSMSGGCSARLLHEW